MVDVAVVSPAPGLFGVVEQNLGLVSLVAVDGADELLDPLLYLVPHPVAVER